VFQYVEVPGVGNGWLLKYKMQPTYIFQLISDFRSSVLLIDNTINPVPCSHFVTDLHQTSIISTVCVILILESDVITVGQICFASKIAFYSVSFQCNFRKGDLY
jgi:hypothetical protein